MLPTTSVQALVVLCVASFLAPSAVTAKAYRPVLVMHGMNNNERGYQKNLDSLRSKYPGIYVKALAVMDDTSSITTPMDKQLAAVIEAVQSDPVIANATNGFNFYGESQGALLARAYVTVVNDPPVHNLVALNGPQNGVGECPTIEAKYFKFLCGDLGTALDIYQWPFCSFCSYWRGKDKATYLAKSKWLADVNNQRSVNETRRQHMISLNKYMCTRALRDEIVQPSQSAWHTYWKWGDDSRSTVMNLSDTEDYKNDVLGLKTLDERGDLVLNEFNGSHVSYDMDWWNTNVLPMFDN